MIALGIQWQHLRSAEPLSPGLLPVHSGDRGPKLLAVGQVVEVVVFHLVWIGAQVRTARTPNDVNVDTFAPRSLHEIAVRPALDVLNRSRLRPGRPATSGLY